MLLAHKPRIENGDSGRSEGVAEHSDQFDPRRGGRVRPRFGGVHDEDRAIGQPVGDKMVADSLRESLPIGPRSGCGKVDSHRHPDRPRSDGNGYKTLPRPLAHSVWNEGKDVLGFTDTQLAANVRARSLAPLPADLLHSDSLRC